MWPLMALYLENSLICHHLVPEQWYDIFFVKSKISVNRVIAYSGVSELLLQAEFRNLTSVYLKMLCVAF